MKKNISVRFEKEPDKDYHELEKQVEKEQKEGIKNSDNQRLLKSINKAVERLKVDAQAGDHIPRKIAAQALKYYQVESLWRMELINYWRLIYTITADEIDIIAFVLDCIDHPTYNKIFGYKKR